MVFTVVIGVIVIRHSAAATEAAKETTTGEKSFGNSSFTPSLAAVSPNLAIGLEIKATPTPL